MAVANRLAALAVVGIVGSSALAFQVQEGGDAAISEPDRPPSMSVELKLASEHRPIPKPKKVRPVMKRRPIVRTPAPTVPEVVGDAKAFIYNHESRNNPAAHNSAGCRGLGQACPGSKLTCSDTDYACQDAWFTRYMQDHYGTWENARAHWISLARWDAKRHDWFGGSW